MAINLSCRAPRALQSLSSPLASSRNVRSSRPAFVAHRGMASAANFKIPAIKNEPNVHYTKGSVERQKLQDAVARTKKQAPINVPLWISGKKKSTQDVSYQLNPSQHSQKAAQSTNATKADVEEAIQAALSAKKEWESMPFADRAAIFLKAADLISGKYRYDIMAATMVGQGKNAWQAEIDAAAELCDFLRYSVKYAEELYSIQPVDNAPGVWNRVEYRALEGFVYAVSPFNFTAIGGNLPFAPALMGNVVLWKPSQHAMASNWLILKIMLEAGLPPNVVQFVPGDPVTVTEVVLRDKNFSALHFTGSTAVFRSLYGQIGEGVAAENYTGYPRIIGETGGKNFHLIHNSADVRNAALHTLRGAFEYQGQKCSACSRAYVPASKWDEFSTTLVEEVRKLKIGDPENFENFIGPVIHKGAFDRLKAVIDEAKNDKSLELLVGGTYDNAKGYFVDPTIYKTSRPDHPLLSRELFGPVLVIYVYDDAEALDKICSQIDSTTNYALTGAVFAQDRAVLRQLEGALQSSAGNFYINTKCTGAVVGQQCFGGARASGTNDKSGSPTFMSRWVSMRAIKEEFVPLHDGVEYPSNMV